MRSRIGDLRERRGLSQRRLARESGVSDCVLSKWERAGLDRAQLGLVVRVARALGVPVEDLYSEE